MSWRLAGAALAVTLLAACGGGEADRGLPPTDNDSIEIALSDAGCSPKDLVLDAGNTRFLVGNAGSSVVTSFRIERGGATIAQVSNIIGGLARSLEVRLEPGTYAMSCTGGGKGGTGAITVN